MLNGCSDKTFGNNAGLSLGGTDHLLDAHHGSEAVVGEFNFLAPLEVFVISGQEQK